MFMSRIDPKKGLDILMTVLARLPADTLLDVYGSGTPAYVGEMVSLARRLNLEDRVVFHGHVVGERKAKAFADADIFILPSHSENFGMAIAEALGHAVPVIVSDQTPWQEVERVGAGYWVDNSPPAIADALARMRKRDLKAMGKAGRKWIRREFDWSRKAMQMLALIEENAACAGRAGTVNS
jgi:glycosyltransferase involved in cell wall biosynthesis